MGRCEIKAVMVNGREKFVVCRGTIEYVTKFDNREDAERLAEKINKIFGREGN